MKRLLKFVTILLVTVTFLMPFSECFDRWDRPGLGNDTEFPVFLVVLLVTLVLLAVATMARRFYDDQSAVTLIKIRYEMLSRVFAPMKRIVIAPFFIPPLRI